MIVIAGPLLLFLIFTAFRISTIDIRPLDPTVSSEAFEFNTNPAVGSVALHSRGLGNPALNISDGILYEEHFR
jgi:hypothetical protein